MATSSLTDIVYISTSEEIEMLANAIEESYEEFLHRAPAPDLKITHIKGVEEARKFMKKGEGKTNA